MVTAAPSLTDPTLLYAVPGPHGQRRTRGVDGAGGGEGGGGQPHHRQGAGADRQGGTTAVSLHVHGRHGLSWGCRVVVGSTQSPRTGAPAEDARCPPGRRDDLGLASTGHGHYAPTACPDNRIQRAARTAVRFWPWPGCAAAMAPTVAGRQAA